MRRGQRGAGGESPFTVAESTQAPSVQPSADPHDTALIAAACRGEVVGAQLRLTESQVQGASERGRAVERDGERRRLCGSYLAYSIVVHAQLFYVCHTERKYIKLN